MSDQDNLSETSTLEMKTEENFNKILNAIGDMRQEFSYRFDGLEKKVEVVEKRVENIEKRVENIEKRIGSIETEQAEMNNFMNVQFEAVRSGIEKNYNQFDRVEAQIAENRSVIFSTKATLGELKESVYLLTRQTKQPF